MWHRARVEKGDSAGGEARKHQGWRAGAMQGQTCCGKGAGARLIDVTAVTTCRAGLVQRLAWLEHGTTE